MNKSAKQFKRSHELVLPSGQRVLAQKPNVRRMVMESDRAEVPEFLTQRVLASLNGVIDESIPNFADETNLPELSKFIDFMVRAVLVWPRIVKSDPDYDAGEILITDLSDEDREYLQVWAMPEEAHIAKSFRGEQNGDVEIAPDVRDVRAEAVSSDGIQEPVDSVGLRSRRKHIREDRPEPIG